MAVCGLGGFTTGRYLRRGLGSMSFLAVGPDWSNMAKIPKCDNCGVLHTAQNPVTEKSHDSIYLANGDINKPGYLGITITPAAHGKDKNYERHDMCKKCLDDIVRSRFVELCAMLAPYQPARVVGFAQGITPIEPEDAITTDELEALKLLSRRLLKA